MEINRIIKSRRQELGLTLKEVATALGIAESTVSRYESSDIQNMGIDKIEALSKVLQCSPAYLMGWTMQDDAVKKIPLKGIKIPVLGRVAAGVPIEAVEEIIDTEEITEELARTGSFFGLKIHGDSMEPRMCEGDVVIVRQQEDADSGDVVIALINGDDATCKRLRKYRDGIELISNNPSYEPMFFSNEEIESKPVRIIGKVVELRGKF